MNKRQELRLIRADYEWQEGHPVVTNIETITRSADYVDLLDALETLQPGPITLTADVEVFDIVDDEYKPVAIVGDECDLIETGLAAYAIGSDVPLYEPQERA